MKYENFRAAFGDTFPFVEIGIAESVAVAVQSHIVVGVAL